jgi:hypothetical protein
VGITRPGYRAVSRSRTSRSSASLVRDTEEALPTFRATRRQLPGPLGASTSVEAGAQALVDNLETRRRRVFVPRSVGVVSALRQVVSGAPSEKVMLKISAGRVPQLEADIATLNGREFGKNSVGNGKSAA